MEWRQIAHHQLLAHRVDFHVEAERQILAPPAFYGSRSIKQFDLRLQSNLHCIDGFGLGWNFANIEIEHRFTIFG
ncbi:hypothetical protein D3C85_1470090 [compost metagenome]